MFCHVQLSLWIRVARSHKLLLKLLLWCLLPCDLVTSSHSGKSKLEKRQLINVFFGLILDIWNPHEITNWHKMISVKGFATFQRHFLSPPMSVLERVDLSEFCYLLLLQACRLFLRSCLNFSPNCKCLDSFSSWKVILKQRSTDNRASLPNNKKCGENLAASFLVQLYTYTNQLMCCDWCFPPSASTQHWQKGSVESL